MTRVGKKRTGLRRWVAVFALMVLSLAVCVGVVIWRPTLLINFATDRYLARNHVEQHEVTVEHHRIHYLEARPGSNSNGRTVLLVHGLGAKASDWGDMIPSLAAHGYHVYAPDLLGYGKSERPVGGDFSLATEERIVSGFARTMQLQRPDVMGWSMGGWITLKYALDEPEHVRRVAVFDSAGMYMPLSFPLDLFTPTTREGFAELNRMIEADHPKTRIPDWAVPGLLREFRRNHAIINSSVSSMLDGREILDFKLYRLRVPLLIVWGTQDKLTPIEFGQRMHELVPDSVFVGIDGCGHLAPAECSKTAIPETFRFLDAEPPLARETRMLPAQMQVSSLVFHSPAVSAGLRQANVLQDSATELGRHFVDRLRPVVQDRDRGE